MNTGAMICGGGVSVYYTAQSTYNESLSQARQRAELTFFTVIFNVDMFRQRHQTSNLNGGEIKRGKQPTHINSQPVSHTEKKAVSTNNSKLRKK